MALATYLVSYHHKGAKASKIIHGQAGMNDQRHAHTDTELVSQLKKGVWTPPLTSSHEEFATWEK